MTDTMDPQELADATRDWRGPLITTEQPPPVPGMQKVPADPPRESFPRSWPPEIA